MADSDYLNYKGGPIEGQVRVRFAPSPTGSLHVGGARTHLFNWLYARHTEGKLIIRVEDTDKERSKPEFEKLVMADIESLGLGPDESPDQGGEYGPYRQSERLEYYQTFATKLLESEKAYRCFCPESELDRKAKAAKAAGKPPHYDGTCTRLSSEDCEKRIAAGETFAVRMAAPPKDYVLHDHIRGKVTFKHGMVGDFVLLRSNGLPVYNFAVVVDDYFMHISHVIRAEEHMPNTLRQKMILEGLGWDEPTFAHISIVLGNDRKKLSKRHGAASVQDYLQEGYLVEALVNFLALLGWSPADNKEIRPLSEIVENFHLAKLTKSPAIFDTDKLKWMNGEYIRSMNLTELCKRLDPFLKAAEYDVCAYPPEWVEKVIDSVRGHLALLSEIGPHLEIYFADKYTMDNEAKSIMAEDSAKSVVSAFQSELEECEHPSAEWLATAQKSVKEKSGAKGKSLFFPLRACVTGRLHGPELKLAVPLIGKEECLRRIEIALRQ